LRKRLEQEWIKSGKRWEKEWNEYCVKCADNEPVNLIPVQI